MKRRRWYKIAGIVLGALLLAGLIGSSMALAQGPQDGPPRFGGHKWQGPRFIEVAAQELGMDTEALRERLRDGESLSEIAAEQGKTLRDLADAFLAAQDEALSEAAKQGYFTQVEAAWRLQQARLQVEHCLAGFNWQRPPLAPIGLKAAAETLSMTEEELRNELREGKTIAGLAERQGVELKTITQALVEAREQELTKAVEEGRLTQEQADKIRARLQKQTELCLLGWPVRRFAGRAAPRWPRPPVHPLQPWNRWMPPRW